jgi:hypothetical protein
MRGFQQCRPAPVNALHPQGTADFGLACKECRFAGVLVRSMRVLFMVLVVLAIPCLGGETQHWAYAPVQMADTRGAHPVDALLSEAREKAGLSPAPLAAPRRWIERAAFTLTGLPPSPEQIQRIESRPDEATWKSLIDELLASPAYGERWARHWMDVARYADTQGYNFDQDNRYPFAYTYRDWLIRAFNEDIPLGQFIKLQIAADHLVKEADHPDLAALGFLTVGPRSGGPETIDDRVDVITRGFLSSTVACARCHEHKTDPITMEDYYSIYSILENTHEPDEKPVIGKPADESAYQAYLKEAATLESADLAARQQMVDQLRQPDSLAVYLDLAWTAHAENWDTPKATSESFKRGRYRPKAVMRWLEFLRKTAFKEPGDTRLHEWAAAMQTSQQDSQARHAHCVALAREWASAPAESALQLLSRRGDCPLSYVPERMEEIMDVEDNNTARKRRSEMSRLQVEHPGSPPRAMSLVDQQKLKPARTYKRGNPGAPEDPFERHWLSFLGGGLFQKSPAPRLQLAEKIADPANPLTARVMANRIWAWHFGAPIADPGDFGPQEPRPALLPLLDTLANRLHQSGGSLKDLHRLLLTSEAFRLNAEGPYENVTKDPSNAFFWKWNRRRADFETMRDRILRSSRSLDLERRGGRSVLLDQPEADSRRSVYAFVDRYALPTTLISFDLPHPDHHSPKRIETTVPQQALWFLNGPLVMRQAEKLISDPEFTYLTTDPARVNWIYQKLLRREPTADESAAIADWLGQIKPDDYESRLGGQWEVRHAKDTGGDLPEVYPFPIFSKGIWKTGPDPATAPIRWLHAGASGGHASRDHALVLRWRATGVGKARMVGQIRRTQKGGNDLVWNLASTEGSMQAPEVLAADAKANIEGPWVNLKTGDTLDFILRAPEGDTCAGVAWDLRIEGCEPPDQNAVEISRLSEAFPNSEKPPALPKAASPWADLVQMLWASNEFHFID